MFTDLESSSDPENQVQDYYGQDSNDSPLSSKASSVSMDDYLRRLFTACDTDNDGYLDRFVPLVLLSFIMSALFSLLY